MISRRFLHILARHHVQYQVDLLRQKGTFSAAGIGELICEHAAKLEAGLMLIASHGESTAPPICLSPPLPPGDAVMPGCKVAVIDPICESAAQLEAELTLIASYSESLRCV